MNYTVEDFLENTHKLQITGLNLYMHNAASTVKLFGVHLSLYAKSLKNLGTEKHKKLLLNAFSLTDVGSFSLTELGHGSNVKSIRTSAVYDKKSNTFIINTPDELAIKFWIGATAELANMTIIWAQLYNDNKCYGVHAFVA
jgi:acyl-CoA oxidase